MNRRELMNILCDINYKPDTGFRIGVMGDAFYMQHWQMVPDCNDPDVEVTLQKGGKRYVSRFACESEVVQGAFAQIMAFEQHEVREYFRYGDKRLFGPHIALHALMSVCDQTEARS